MIYNGTVRSGSGKASKVFVWNSRRRINEIGRALHEKVVPGTLNLLLDKRFDFDNHAYWQAFISDGKLKDGTLFKPKICRFYKCKLMDKLDVWVIKFDGGEQKYTKGVKYSVVTNKVEIISQYNLREKLNLKNGDIITLETYDEEI